MNEPRLGFGWNDVAFSGSRTPVRTTSMTRSRSTAGSRAAVTRPGFACVEGLGERVRVGDLRGRLGSRRAAPLDELDDGVPGGTSSRTAAQPGRR